MEKLTLRSYIEKRIQGLRTKYFDDIAKYYLQEESVLSPEDYARNAAERAMPNLTASYLNFTNLPISEKGKILSEAYKRCRSYGRYIKKYSGYGNLVDDSLRVRKIAQGLARAAKRV